MSEDVLQYRDTKAVVTGAASGMGLACVRILVEMGAEVHGIDLNPVTVEGAVSHVCDLSNTASIDETLRDVGDGIDSLFNCAGLPTTAPPQKVMRVNFLGHRHLTEAALGSINQGGAIGFISSAAGMGWMTKIAELVPLVMSPDFEAGAQWCDANDEITAATAYGLSKEAINTYVSLRGFQLAPEGVRMNAIMPGPTDTPMMPSFVETMGEDYMASLPKPIGRNSTPEEQAWPLIMLNSPRSSYVTATIVATDGGFSGGLFTGGIDPATLQP